MIKRIKKLFCRHKDTMTLAHGVGGKDKGLFIRVTYKQCLKCGKTLVVEKPKKKYLDPGKRQIETYYGGTNPND